MSSRCANHRLSVGPMIDRTDRHFRFFMRCITRTTLLYTEMITTHAILHGNRNRLLDFHQDEHPIALQLGGDDAEALATCARIGADWGYDEINLNVGCPSDRVQQGRFGACLMREPAQVAKAVAAMRKAVAIPVTVKHRIGIDEIDSYQHMASFVKTVAAAGADRFTVHARKAWLQGLDPKQNRTIPPLRYEDVHRLKEENPHLLIEINGGITTLPQITHHLNLVDAVMIGRAAIENPYLFAEVDRHIGGISTSPPSRTSVVTDLLPYVEEQLAARVKLTAISRHLLTLFNGQPGARQWRRFLSEKAHVADADSSVLLQALEVVKTSF